MRRCVRRRLRFRGVLLRAWLSLGCRWRGHQPSWFLLPDWRWGRRGTYVRVCVVCGKRLPASLLRGRPDMEVVIREGQGPIN